MYDVILINLVTGKRFVKTFDSLFLCRKFVEKCRFSKKVKVVGHPIFD